MNDLNLVKINQILIEIENEIQNNLGTFYEIEAKYLARKYDLLLHSMLGNAPAREAEANLIVQKEPIFNQFMDVKLKMKKLWSKKEMYIELSKNMRALETQIK